MSPDMAASVLDPAALERLLRIGGQDFVVEMIELFLEHAPQRLASARAALAENDVKTLYRSAHSLKSTAGNLGARALQNMAAEVEKRSAKEDLEPIPPLLEELERRYERVRTELETERDRRKGGAT